MPKTWVLQRHGHASLARKQGGILTCDDCGKPIRTGDSITAVHTHRKWAKNTHKYYHADCFKRNHIAKVRQTQLSPSTSTSTSTDHDHDHERTNERTNERKC